MEPEFSALGNITTPDDIPRLAVNAVKSTVAGSDKKQFTGDRRRSADSAAGI